MCSREASFAHFVTCSLLGLLDLMSLVPVALARCSMGIGEVISGIGFKPKLVLSCNSSYILLYLPWGVAFQVGAFLQPLETEGQEQ